MNDDFEEEDCHREGGEQQESPRGLVRMYMVEPMPPRMFSNSFPPQQIRLFVDSECTSLNLIGRVDIGQNVKCMIFEEPLDALRSRLLLDASKYPGSVVARRKDYSDFLKKKISNSANSSHLIFAFNWFSPQNWWDYVTLGMQMYSSMTSPSDIDIARGGLGKLFLSKADQFLNSSLMQRLLTSILKNEEDSFIDDGGGFAAVPSPSELLKKLRKRKQIPAIVTCTGFSLGGALANAFGYLLSPRLKESSIALRIVGMGSPRVGNEDFSNWFINTCLPDSMNIILSEGNSFQMSASYDPVCLNGKEEGFHIHPNPHALSLSSGMMRPMSYEEVTDIDQNSKARKSTWNRMHGVNKYYEAMCGLMGE